LCKKKLNKYQETFDVNINSTDSSIRLRSCSYTIHINNPQIKLLGGNNCKKGNQLLLKWLGLDPKSEFVKLKLSDNCRSRITATYDPQIFEIYVKKYHEIIIISRWNAKKLVKKIKKMLPTLEQ
jgi:hypothetical protein